MKKHLLITGFGPFPGMAINPSTRLAEALAALPCWSWLGWKVRAAILPVGYGPTEEKLAHLLAKKPRAVLMFGVAARRKAISIEMLARNRASRTQRDQSGRLPKTSALDDGPPILKGRAPMRVLRDVMRENGLRTKLSRNAGPYLCNAGYRFALRRTEADVPVVFVHIPRVQRSGDNRGLRFTPLLKGSEAIARRMVLAARLSGRTI
jgi:pyroglutamyl-peptidase